MYTGFTGTFLKYIKKIKTIDISNFDVNTFVIDTGFGFPLVRRVFPELLANKMVPVQPMHEPLGIAYALKYLYGNNKEK